MSRAGGEKEPDRVTRGQGRDHFGERRIGQAVAVGGEEDLVVLDVRLYLLEPLADQLVETRVDEGHRPVVDVAVEQLDLLAPVAEHEVVRERLVVAEEVLLDRVRLVAEAEHELADSEGGVVLHDVPENRPVADRDHGLRDALGERAHA